MDELMLEVRKSQRLLVAYYQRIQDSVKAIADGLGVKFYVWEPAHFSRLGNLTTNPLSRWAWDMVPLFETCLVFTNAKDANKQSVEEWLLEIRVITDSVFYEEGVGRIEPDPLSIAPPESTESRIEIYAYRPITDQNNNWYSSWLEAETPDPKESFQVDQDLPHVGAGLIGCGLIVQFVDIADQKSLHITINQIAETLRGAGFPQSN
ncbi:hypothetical protein [Amphritea sp. HPY]|uniref:hypothetical protein n=1 Tax=Amphritea sp. HPY TaxID=3421652 RepID=UPI003D7EC5F9